jgi:cytochrome P450
MGPSFDFLTLLLSDELYKDNDKMMLDECPTFIGAATQTTTFLITNCCYYLTKNPEVRAKLLSELKEKIFSKIPATTSQSSPLSDPRVWQDLLIDQRLLDDCHYLSLVVQETLRIESSATISSAIALSETCQIGGGGPGGKTFRSDSQIAIAIHRLHHNPEEWQEPSRFIPERFSPESKYFLTPSGKRRSVFSYGPFLGGKRISLGKTFAENVAKALIPLFIC